MAKKLLVLLVFIGILVIGCTANNEVKETGTQITIEKSNNKSEPTQETTRDIGLLADYNYPINTSYLDIDSSQLIEIGEAEDYAIRVFIYPATCKGIPIGPEGCQGKDWGAPIYAFINVDFNLSDEQRSYSTIGGAWENSPKLIAVNGNNVLIKIGKEDYSWRVTCGINTTENSCGGYFMIFNDVNQSIIKTDLMNELTNLKIIDNVSNFDIVVEEGFIRPRIY